MVLCTSLVFSSARDWTPPVFLTPAEKHIWLKLQRENVQKTEDSNCAVFFYLSFIEIIYFCNMFLSLMQVESLIFRPTFNYLRCFYQKSELIVYD